MKQLLRYSLPCTAQRWIKLLICLIFFLGICSSFSWLVHAEGSRSLYPAGATGFRANLEWRTSSYGALVRRRALLKVYAEAGEVILLGSSAVGVANGDILLYNPGRVTGTVGDETIPPLPNFSCQDQRDDLGNPDQGRITSRAQELAGPDTITDTTTASPGLDVPNGYVPCFYTAPAEGIYNVVFYGPAGGNSDAELPPTGEIELSSPANFDVDQTTSVAAWDVTVRSELTSTEDLNGRLFADYLAVFTGGNPRPMSSIYYVLTTDGLIYRTELNGLDPDGFVVYANSKGFCDSDGSTALYRDVMADPSIPPQEQDQLNVLQGAVGLALPTHPIFFAPPRDEAILANNIPLTPVVPEIGSIVFNGNLGGNNSTVGAGGTFVFTSNITSTYELIVSRNGFDFDPTNPLNRVLRNALPAGTQNIVWDGVDNTGNPFPTGTYSTSITIRRGEYHFPLLDVENSLGGPQYELINPPGGVCPSFYGSPPNCFTAFYDDRGYTTLNGTDVGIPGDPLPGIVPPNPARSDPLMGFDTTTNQRAFGDGSGAGFGDKKGLDLWTYYPSEPKSTILNIVALNLMLNKTDDGIITAPGNVITYTLTYTNTGPTDATGVIITETVPANTTFNALASDPTVWSCPDRSPAGTTCPFTVGRLAAGDTDTVTFAVTVDDPLPQGVTEIFNTAVIGDDGASGPEPLYDNSDSEDTPLTIPEPPTPIPTIPTPTPTPTPSTPPATPVEPPKFPTPVPPAIPIPPREDDDATPAVPIPPREDDAPVDVFLPVTLLPETGMRNASGVGQETVGIGLLLATLIGISAAILLGRR